MATAKEPVKKATQVAPTDLDTLLRMAAICGFILIPASAAPAPLSNQIKPNNVVDMLLIVAQNNPQAVDDAESIATALTAGCGHFTSHTHRGDNMRMEHPFFFTYLDRA